MSKNKKVILAVLAIGSILVCSLAFFGIPALPSLLCKNEVIETSPAPSGKEKAVVFSVDCGATTGWAVHVSVIGNDQQITDEDSGNVFRIGSNHGAAYPTDRLGRPVVIPKWVSDTKLEIYHSSSGDIFYQQNNLGSTSVSYTMCPSLACMGVE